MSTRYIPLTARWSVECDAPYLLTWRLEWEPSYGDGRGANGEEGGRRERERERKGGEKEGEREKGEERGRRERERERERERGEEEEGEVTKLYINYYDFVTPTTIIRQTLSGFLATNNDLFNGLMFNSNTSCMASYIILKTHSILCTCKLKVE